jgi:hypothetical protein
MLINRFVLIESILSCLAALRALLHIRFFVPNNPNAVETIQADVIPPVGSQIRFPNGAILVATQIRLELPAPGLTLQVVDVMVQQQ